MDVRSAVGVLVGAGLTLLVLHLEKKSRKSVPQAQQLQVFSHHDPGQLVNWSRIQKRHELHIDTVDDVEESTDTFEGDDAKPMLKKARSVCPTDWREKEDSLIRLLFELMSTNLSLEFACEKAEQMIHNFLDFSDGELGTFAPDLMSPSHRASATRQLHQSLPLSEAFRLYDKETHFSKRKMVPPQFREVRNLINVAQVLASAREGLRLVTFDGDGTLYPDRSVLDETEGSDKKTTENAADLVSHLASLLELGVNVALCTAVGEPLPAPYDKRLKGLLKRLEQRGKPTQGKLFAVGGQCNYVFCYSSETNSFVPMSRASWEPQSMRQWSPELIGKVLDAAQTALLTTATQLGMDGKVQVVRKERAVGLIYMGENHRTTSFFLDELALQARVAVRRIQEHLPGGQQLPFCTFNGGRDVFVDVGTKELGINVLRRICGASRAQTLHVGDQFTRTGNDLLTRRACGTLWVDDPQQTAVLLKKLLHAMQSK